MSSYTWPATGGSSSGVASLNSETGAITLVGGTGITVTPSGQNITITATGAELVFADSIVNNAGTITLVGDTATPGSLKYYGTNASSVLGYYPVPVGTVTSVGLSVPTFLSVSGSPITGSGTLAVSLSGTALPVANGGTGQTSLGNLTDAGTDGITITGGTGALIVSASISQHVADTTHNGYLASTDWNTFNSKGSGTVTSVSVVSSNGFAGTVATSTTTPAITLSTTVTGILQGNGTAISAATTTGTGSVVLGTGPTITLANGSGLPLTTGVTGILPVANGGTGSGTALTQYGVKYASSTTVETTTAAGTNGQVLTATSGAPTWAAPLFIPATSQVYTSTGTSTYIPSFMFIVSGITTAPTAGATYTNNSVTYTVQSTNTAKTQIWATTTTTSATTSGTTLTKTGGTGDSSITFTQVINPLYLKVTVIGAGGGGGGANVSGSAGGGGAGGSSAGSFGTSLISCTSGSGAVPVGANNSPGGSGGSPTINAPAIAVLPLSGGSGASGNYASISTISVMAGDGGSNAVGGNGMGGSGSGVSTSAVNNSGAGGGGAGTNGAALGATTGGGGGAGGYALALVPNPTLAGYSVVVPSGGLGATSAGAGGSGFVSVEEHYQ